MYMTNSYKYYNNLMPCYILIELRHYNYYTQHNYYKRYSFTVCRDTLNNSKGEVVLKHFNIHLFYPKWDINLLSYRASNLGPIFIYIIYIYSHRPEPVIPSNDRHK